MYVGKIKMDELRNAHAIVNDLWQLIKKYYVPESNPDDPYWHNLMNEAERIVIKNNNHRLAQKLTLAFLDYVEEAAHGRP